MTAAGLKLFGMNVTALPRAGWFAMPQVQVATAEWELVLGLWLLSGAALYGAWLAAIGTFLGFAIVSAYFGWIGVAGCGCFGAIKTSPWTAFAVDVVAILALLIWRPRSNLPRTLPSRSSAVIPLGAAATLLALTGNGTWVYGWKKQLLAAAGRRSGRWRPWASRRGVTTAATRTTCRPSAEQNWPTPDTAAARRT